MVFLILSYLDLDLLLDTNVARRVSDASAPDCSATLRNTKEHLIVGQQMLRFYGAYST
jgi:hypothetical protein